MNSDELNLGVTLGMGNSKKEIDDLNLRAKDLRKTLSDIEKSGGKGSENWKKYKTELKGVEDQAKNAAKALKTMDVGEMTVKQLTKHVSDLKKEVANIPLGMLKTNEAVKRLKEAEAQLAKVKTEAGLIKKGAEDLGKPTLWQKVSTGVTGIATVFKAFIALQAVQYVIGIGKAIFDTTAKFEGYNKSLAATYRATMNKTEAEKAAASSMKALAKLAKDSPMTLDEITKGYIALANRGLRPSEEQMKRLIDFSSKSRLSLSQLGEAILDVNNNERWSEFGVKVKTSGDKITATIGGVTKSFERTEKGALQLAVEMGKLPGTMGYASQQMDSLNGKVSNIDDAMDALKVTIGQKLAPVFVAILNTIGKGIEWLQNLVEASDPVVEVFQDMYDAVGDLAGSFMTYIRTLFPNFNSGGVSLQNVMKGVAMVFRGMLMPTQMMIGVLTMVYDAMAGLVEGGKAVAKVLMGDFKGAAESFEKSKKNFTNVGTHATSTFDKIKKGWTETFVDQPKKDEAQAVLAAETTENKRQNALTEEQKKALEKREKAAKKAEEKRLKQEAKHLEDVKDANAKALELLEQLNAEHDQIVADSSIKTEEAKINEKRRKRLKEVNDSLADETIKERARVAINKTADADIEKAKAEAREKQKKAEAEAAQKREEAAKFIREQEKAAEMALLDWKELQAKGNAKKLLEVAKERLDTELRLKREALKAEQAEAEAKAKREITDTQQLEAALKAIRDRYRNEDDLAMRKHTDQIQKLEEETKQARIQKWKEGSDGITALLKGDLVGFVTHMGNLVKGEKEAWQKRLEENMAKYEAVAQIATAAVNFLNDLAQRKAQREIELAKKERDEKVAILTEGLEKEKAELERIEDEKRGVKEQAEAKVQEIKAQSEQNISALEAQYRQLTSVENTSALNAQLESYKENAAEKAAEAKANADSIIQTAKEETAAQIELIKEKKQEAIEAANNEKLEKIDAAEIARDAEIAAIKMRADIDSATKQKLLEEARAKFESEKELAESETKTKIDLATTEAKSKIDLANSTFKTKKEMAELQRDAELKAIDDVKKGDLSAAKETLAKAKQDQAEKIRLAKEESKIKIDEAEKEKREKLKKLELEKQTRIQSKKQLESSIAAEDKRARDREAAAKRQAWKAQQKADIASALISGALATIKALASGFFPLNLVFAAVTAVMTGIQVAMIKRQPEPSFAHGGFVPRGGRHGSRYGDGGIALIDRKTGSEVGEMEGDEAIISRDQTEANMPLIQQMFQNARTPGQRRKPVGGDLRGPAYRDGGIAESPYWKRDMFLFGGKKKKKAEEEARRAEEEAAAQEASAGGGEYSADAGSVEGGGDADAAHAEAKAQGEKQLKLLEGIQEEGKKTNERLMLLAAGVGTMSNTLGDKLGGVQAAVNEVKDAVNGSNQGGKLDSLIGAISSFGRK
ncbi:hypothetical protein DR864_27270 [Runella rosea]|uniref:Tape measure protein n=1 Tax=Runella rosea TaxID=2259595 RepID=A0A344TRA3_9BACT|nr:hypothetical protein [Runella rosea]AXE21174.1 hypothetical protein DR864_27270 [Runella rosea]